ncbi:hypothetical protein GH714_016952 [Hevea brasiliensis]|uniref:Uncharacterized protein n=1 Tax=Hevea brasiliensis TaxID=3981 RepID=A0A6A6KQK0_HEVBR|nr:hypothetical protein GH714_016952 [Hevea brasiliensis]
MAGQLSSLGYALTDIPEDADLWLVNTVKYTSQSAMDTLLTKGRDIGVDLPTLFNAIVAELTADASIMLRIGMTNPPFILEHLRGIAEVLCHLCKTLFFMRLCNLGVILF